MTRVVTESFYDQLVSTAEHGGYTSTALSIVEHDGFGMRRVHTLEPGRYIVTENGYSAHIYYITAALTLQEVESSE